MKRFAALIAKTYSHITDNKNEDKKTKGTKKCIVKTKIKFEDYRHCLEATQLENKKNHLEKKITGDILRGNHNDFIKNNELIL